MVAIESQFMISSSTFVDVVVASSLLIVKLHVVLPKANFVKWLVLNST
ncbi:MAG: hypothetical protein WCG25_04220 [bacterium]